MQNSEFRKFKTLMKDLKINRQKAIAAHGLSVKNISKLNARPPTQTLRHTK